MLDYTFSPTSIQASRKNRVLTILWNDGHTSVYPFGLLRAACPCASCRGGHENMRTEPDPDVFEKQLPESVETRLADIRAVGTYAVSFVWEDGHDFGIFNWYFLRKLCPCDLCRATASS